MCMNRAMSLNDKKLLLMGGGAYFSHIKQYQRKKGFKLIAIGNNESAEYFKDADESFLISTMDIDKIIDLVNKKQIDGIFAGANEDNILSAIKVSEKTKARFYSSFEQWEILSDKASFKDLCRKYSVPVVPEYNILKVHKIEELKYPVIIKPVDGSGARGINICYEKEKFKELYEIAMDASKKKKVIVEKYIDKAEDVFFEYTFQNGKCALTASFSKERTLNRDGKNNTLPIFHFFPSKRIDEYYDSIHNNIIKMFEGLGIQNGVMTIQSFYTQEGFYIYEAGYRMGGAQNYILTEWLNGSNNLEYMINYALTGEMSSEDIQMSENAYFKYPCCNYYIGLKPGRIKHMPLKEEVERFPGVLNATMMRKPGDVIEDTNALDRICIRLHVKGNTTKELAENLVDICSAVKIISDDGQDMKIEYLDYARCISAIEKSVWKGLLV